MGVALLFPGQGSQYPRMLRALPDQPAVAATLDEVSDAISSDIRNLDSDAALQSTVAVQLCIFAAGIAVGRALLATNIKPLAVAGLSVGAYAAAVVSGALSTGDGARLVKQRAELMAQNFESGYGMSAIVGLDQRQVTAIVSATSTESAPVYVSNINAARQIVIAGANAGMDAVLKTALAQGARKAERLNVSVPSHCQLLQPVAAALQKTLSSITLQKPKAIYISNVSARPLRAADEIADDLANNIANPVQWYHGNVVLKELGCTLFIEVNPGHVLTDLAAENVEDVRAISMETTSLRYASQLATQSQNGES